MSKRHPPVPRGLFPTGKLPPEHLKRQLERMAHADKRVIIGPRYGEDATVIDIGGRLFVCACDPVTLASERIGRYAVHVNANDIAVMGALPRWFWATVLLPEGKSDERLVEAIFRDMRETCRGIGVELCGGHTEITPGLARPIVSGFMSGEAEKETLVDKKTIRPGDDIVMSRGIAIEGTATIALDRPHVIAPLGDDLIRRAGALLSDPGICVIREAQLAVRTARVHGMHDPTEGGISTGLRELAEVAEVGLEINEGEIDILPETQSICSHLRLDPMGLLASGSLIIVTDPASTGALLAAYRKNKIPASLIGKTRKREFGLRLRRAGTLFPLPEFERDELLRIP